MNGDGSVSTVTADREIEVEYRLIVDLRQEEELVGTVMTVVRLADDHDGLLQRELGSGVRAADARRARPGTLPQ